MPDNQSRRKKRTDSSNRQKRQSHRLGEDLEGVLKFGKGEIERGCGFQPQCFEIIFDRETAAGSRSHDFSNRFLEDDATLDSHEFWIDLEDA